MYNVVSLSRLVQSSSAQCVVVDPYSLFFAVAVVVFPTDAARKEGRKEGGKEAQHLRNHPPDAAILNHTTLVLCPCSNQRTGGSDPLWVERNLAVIISSQPVLARVHSSKRWRPWPLPSSSAFCGSFFRQRTWSDGRNQQEEKVGHKQSCLVRPSFHPEKAMLHATLPFSIAVSHFSVPLPFLSGSRDVVVHQSSCSIKWRHKSVRTTDRRLMLMTPGCHYHQPRLSVNSG